MHEIYTTTTASWETICNHSVLFFPEAHLASCSFFLTLRKTRAAPQMLFCLLLSTQLNREQYNTVSSQLTKCISEPCLHAALEDVGALI